MKPSVEPRIGDEVEVFDIRRDRWDPAVITDIRDGRIMGEGMGVRGQKFGFGFSIDSYRRCWRWSQRVKE